MSRKELKNKFMERIGLMLFIAFVGFLSCSDKDDNIQQVPPKDISIVGTWIPDSIIYSGETEVYQIVNPNDTIPQLVKVDIKGFGYNNDFTSTLTENPNKVASEGTHSVKLYAIAYGNIADSLDQKNQEFDFNGDWQLQGDQLMVSDTTGVDTLQVATLAEKKLVLEDSITQTLKYKGEPVEVDMKIRAVFRR